MADPSARPFTVTADGAPGISRGVARGARFAAMGRGLRVPVATDLTLTVRSEAVMLVARPDAVLWGPSAAAVLGLPMPLRMEEGKVHVLVPEGRPRMRRAGVRPRQADITPAEIVRIDGQSVTSPARTFCDLAASLGMADLVAVGDAARRIHHLSMGELDYVIRRRLRYTGKVKARYVAPWLTDRAESPQESRLRAHVVFNGLPLPGINIDIVDDDGQFLARGDLVFERWRVVVEYDGAVNGTESQRRKDAARRTLLREHGWHVVEITADDLRYPQRAVAKIRAAIALHTDDASSLVARNRR